jgi:hypothetical protein
MFCLGLSGGIYLLRGGVTKFDDMTNFDDMTKSVGMILFVERLNAPHSQSRTTGADGIALWTCSGRVVTLR